MSKILLAPYSIRIFNSNDRTKALKFNECFTNNSILDVIEQFLLSIKDSFTDSEDAASLIRIKDTYKIGAKNIITGVIETGDYGMESTFYNRKGEHQYERKKDHAEVMPFYFCLNLEPQKDTGTIILQRFGQYGISNVFIKRLKEYIKSRDNKLNVDINPIVSNKVLQQIINQGAIKKVVFSKYEIPKDLASHFSNTEGTKEIPGYMQMSLIAKKGKFLDLNERLNKLIFGDGTVNSLLKINNFEYDNTKVEIEYNGTKRTIDVANNKFRAYYDVTSDVERKTDLHPKFESIDSIAQDLLLDFSKLTL